MVDHRAISIEYLPNEFLLHIFSFHRLLSGQSYPDRPLSVAWRWHTLAHVCQQWRDLIFWSLCHLEVRLTIPRKSPKRRCIPGPSYLFPSGTQPSTTSTACVCRRTSELTLSLHLSTLTAYAKSVSQRRWAIHFGDRSAANRSWNWNTSSFMDHLSLSYPMNSCVGPLRSPAYALFS